MTVNFWTPEKDQLMQELAAVGSTSAVIADKLGCTRNAVIGRLVRLQRSGVTKVKLKRTSAAHRATNGAELAARARIAPKPTLARAAPVLPPPPYPEPLPVAVVPVDVPRDTWRINLLRRRAGECAKPLWGNDRNIPIRAKFYCGRRTIPGKSYCPECDRVLFYRRPA